MEIVIFKFSHSKYHWQPFSSVGDISVFYIIWNIMERSEIMPCLPCFSDKHHLLTTWLSWKFVIPFRLGTRDLFKCILGDAYQGG